MAHSTTARLRHQIFRLNGCDRAGARDYAAFLGFLFLEPS